MKIRYFATIREFTRTKESQRNQPACLLGELLRTLSAQYGRNFEDWVLNGNNDLGPHIIILVNGCDVRHLAGINTLLQPDDVVSIFPAIAGG